MNFLRIISFSPNLLSVVIIINIMYWFSSRPNRLLSRMILPLSPLVYYTLHSVLEWKQNETQGNSQPNDRVLKTDVALTCESDLFYKFFLIQTAFLTRLKLLGSLHLFLFPLGSFLGGKKSHKGSS